MPFNYELKLPCPNANAFPDRNASVMNYMHNDVDPVLQRVVLHGVRFSSPTVKGIIVLYLYFRWLYICTVYINLVNIFNQLWKFMILPTTKICDHFQWYSHTFDFWKVISGYSVQPESSKKSPRQRLWFRRTKGFCPEDFFGGSVKQFSVWLQWSNFVRRFPTLKIDWG